MDATPRFYRLRAAMTVKDPAVVYLGNNLPHPEGRIADWNPNEIALARVLADQRDMYEDLARPRLVISPRLQSLLQAFVPDQVQFLPVRLQSSAGDHEQPGFAVLQVLEMMPLHAANVHASQDRIFRIPSSPRDIRVTESLKSRLIDARLSGVEFV